MSYEARVWNLQIASYEIARQARSLDDEQRLELFSSLLSARETILHYIAGAESELESMKDRSRRLECLIRETEEALEVAAKLRDIVDCLLVTEGSESEL